MNIVKLSPSPKELAATLSVPGSKSYTNRALVTAALAPGVTKLSRASMSADSDAMIAALELLGVSIHSSPSNSGSTLLVEGRGKNLLAYHGEIDIGPAGTTMRFLTALCAGVRNIDVVLKGSPRMHKRPIAELVTALRTLGAEIEYLGDDGCPPLRITSPQGLKGGPVSIDGSISSQFISALLLASPLTSEGMSITLTGEQISKSYIDMTLQEMSDFGVDVHNDDYRKYVVSPKAQYAPRHYVVEGDASGASYLWGLAAIAGGSVTVENVNPRSAQGDIQFPRLLAEMGCAVEYGERSITVSHSGPLKAIEVDMELMPDTAQTLAVIAGCATGTTVIRGLSTLRGKETDRIAALHTELAKVGIASEEGPDYLIVHGGAPHAARIATYDDHRMAMSFAMLGASLAGMKIEDPHVVDKSFPTFWKTLVQVGMTVEPC
jgi:3-phosphoshikimate 1-carboxyvinyltransferase